MISVISGARRARSLSNRDAPGRGGKSAIRMGHISYVNLFTLTYARVSRRTDRNKAFMVDMRIALPFISDFFAALASGTLSVLGRYIDAATIPGPRPKHGVPAAGRQCISAHYPKITIIL